MEQLEFFFLLAAILKFEGYHKRGGNYCKTLFQLQKRTLLSKPLLYIAHFQNWS